MERVDEKREKERCGEDFSYLRKRRRRKSDFCQEWRSSEDETEPAGGVCSSLTVAP